MRFQVEDYVLLAIQGDYDFESYAATDLKAIYTRLVHCAAIGIVTVTFTETLIVDFPYSGTVVELTGDESDFIIADIELLTQLEANASQSRTS